MYYYKVLNGPTLLKDAAPSTGEDVYCVTLLPPGESLEEPGLVVCCEEDLTEHVEMSFKRMMQRTLIYCGDKTYEHRAQIQKLDNENNIVLIVLEMTG